MSASIVDARSVFRLRKEGHLVEALGHARELFKTDAKNVWNRRALCWCLISSAWAAIKQKDRAGADRYVHELAPLVDRDDEQLAAAATKLQNALSDNTAQDILSGLKMLAGRVKQLGENQKPDPSWGAEANHLLARYARLPDVHRAGLTHSLALSHAVRLAPVLPRFLDFVQWWNTNLLREEDYTPFSPPNADKPLPSLAERLAKALHHAWPSDPNKQKHLPWIETFLANARRKQPDSPWLPYYHALTLAELGRNNEARSIFVPFATRHAGQHWVWGALAKMSADLPELATACFARALACGAPDPVLLLSHRAGLARLWISAGRRAAARVEVDAALDTRRRHKWRIDERWTELEEQTRDVKPDRDEHQRLIRESLARLDTLLFPPDTPAIVIHVNRAKEITAFAIGPAREALASFKAVPAARSCQPGDLVLLHIQSAQPGRPAFVNALKKDPKSSLPPFCRSFRGALKRNANGFGFVDDIFVPAPLVNAVNGCARVAGLAVRALKRPDKPDLGWRAITCNPEDTSCPAS